MVIVALTPGPLNSSRTVPSGTFVNVKLPVGSTGAVLLVPTIVTVSPALLDPVVLARPLPPLTRPVIVAPALDEAPPFDDGPVTDISPPPHAAVAAASTQTNARFLKPV